MLRARKSILIRIFLFIFAGLVVLTALCGTFLYHMTKQALVQEMGKKCLGIAISVATLFEQDTDALKIYVRDLDTDSEYYRKMKQNMENIRFGNQDNVAFLYVEHKISEDSMQYLFDGELPGTDTYAAPGVVEPLTSTRSICYDSGQPYVGTFVKTVWGNLMSAYAPIHDPATGEVLAIVGADISFQQYSAVTRSQLIMIILDVFVLLFLAAMAMVLSSSRIENHVLRDGLTGAYNRSFFIDTLKTHLKAIRRKEYPVTVFILDIDCFKEINDTYGHLFGDKVLAAISAVLDSMMRRSDCFARYGGDEFCAVMPGMNLEAARKVLPRIVQAAKDTTIREEEIGVTLNVSLSMGVVEMTKSSSVSSILNEADIALYEAKKNRDTIVFYPDRKHGFPVGDVQNTSGSQPCPSPMTPEPENRDQPQATKDAAGAPMPESIYPGHLQR